MHGCGNPPCLFGLFPNYDDVCGRSWRNPFPAADPSTAARANRPQTTTDNHRPPERPESNTRHLTNSNKHNIRAQTAVDTSTVLTISTSLPPSSSSLPPSSPLPHPPPITRTLPHPPSTSPQREGRSQLHGSSRESEGEWRTKEPFAHVLLLACVGSSPSAMSSSPTPRSSQVRTSHRQTGVHLIRFPCAVRSIHPAGI